MVDGPSVSCVGLSTEIGRLVAQRTEAAVGSLELAADLSAVRICVDDLPGDDDAWFGMGTPAAEGDRPVLTVFCHGQAFARARPAHSTVFPPQKIWEQSDGPPVDPPLAAGDFEPARANAFLYHHLLTARDLVRSELRAAEIPLGLVEPFGALWAVAVDGRLHRAELPGYAMADRRGRFSRLFSSAGILMPEHWQIFQSLWEGALSGQRDVLALVRQLPRL